MTSTAAFILTMTLLRKNAVGEWTIPQFEEAINAEQIDFFRNNVPAARDLGAQNRMSAFIKRLPVPLVNGIGTYNPGGNTLGDLYSGPYAWVAAMPVHDCDRPANAAPRRITVPILDGQEFDFITADTIDGPTTRKPKATLLNDREIQVLPAEITYIHLWYYRKPRRIVVGRDPAYPFPKERPLEGGVGQVDPEWNDQDMNLIIYNALAKAGIPLQADRLVQAGTTMGRDK